MVTHHLILGGDLNCVLSSTLDCSASRTISISKSAHTIQNFLKTYGMADVWRFRNPITQVYSFFSPVRNSYSHIDYFIIDTNLVSSVIKWDYEAIIISDHGPLTMTVCIDTKDPNYHPWRFNFTLLSDETFGSYISSEIDSFLRVKMTLGMAVSTVWEALKAYLRGQIISYCAGQSKTRKDQLK